MTILLALAAALTYGAADFFGGLATRRVPPASVVAVSQLFGAVVLAVAWPLVPGHFARGDLLLGVLGGAAGGLAVAALYAALARGRMGVVSPVTAVLGASVPVAAGFFLGDRPTTVALAGVAAAFVAVALVSTNAETRRLSPREPGIGLAVVSGLAIGVLYVTLGRGHVDSGLARLALVRATSLTLVLAYVLGRSERLWPPRDMLPTVALAGVLDMTANVLYVLAARHGMLAIVAVLTSLYPASTVFLARAVLGERLGALQWAGVGFAAVGIVLIAAC